MGLYLKDKKISPALITTDNTIKTGAPICKIDYDKDRLYIFPNPYTPITSGGFQTYVNGELDSRFANAFTGYNTAFKKGPFICNMLVYNESSVKDFDLSVLGAGKYDIQSSARARR